MSHGRFNNPLVAALAGFKDLFRKQEIADRLTDDNRFDNKTCLVTGANSGLAFAVAVGMAKRGAKVICPRPVHSTIIKETPLALRFMLGAIFKVVFRSPKEAALPVVYMSVSPDYEGRTNKYQHMFKSKKMDE